MALLAGLLEKRARACFSIIVCLPFILIIKLGLTLNLRFSIEEIKLTLTCVVLSLEVSGLCIGLDVELRLLIHYHSLVLELLLLLSQDSCCYLDLHLLIHHVLLYQSWHRVWHESKIIYCWLLTLELVSFVQLAVGAARKACWKDQILAVFRGLALLI